MKSDLTALLADNALALQLLEQPGNDLPRGAENVGKIAVGHVQLSATFVASVGEIFFKSNPQRGKLRFTNQINHLRKLTAHILVTERVEARVTRFQRIDGFGIRQIHERIRCDIHRQLVFAILRRKGHDTVGAGG